MCFLRSLLGNINSFILLNITPLLETGDLDLGNIYCLLLSLQQLLELLNRGSEGGQLVVVVEEEGALVRREVGQERSIRVEERSRSEDGVGGEVTGVE